MTRTSSSRRPPPARPSSAIPSAAGRSASSRSTCGATSPVRYGSAARPCACCCLAAGSPSNGPRRGRSPPTRTSTPKLDRIEYALHERPDRTFAFDEFGPLGIRPTAGACWAGQGKPDRLPATYHRTHGTRYFHGCYSVGDDTLWGVNRRRKGISPTWTALKSIRAARPDGAPIYVIMDNLSAHKNKRIRRWAARNKVELCFTPTNASWANPIEAHFWPLRQFTSANSNHPNHIVQTRELHRYLRWRNQNARHPDLLAAQRRERARIRSEKGIRWGGRPLNRVA
ncbi:hypothetical protein GCM10010388_73880 [Streptomyces mauvecolor]